MMSATNSGNGGQNGGVSSGNRRSSSSKKSAKKSRRFFPDGDGFFRSRRVKNLDWKLVEAISQVQSLRLDGAPPPQAPPPQNIHAAALASSAGTDPATAPVEYEPPMSY